MYRLLPIAGNTEEDFKCTACRLKAKGEEEFCATLFS